MARTKKQTIDAATERKRQFQEEIYNQNHVENTKKEEKVDCSSSESTNAQSEKLRIRPSKLNNVVKEDSSRMSSPSKSTDKRSVLPEVVVRVTDICKSPTEARNEELVCKSRDISPRNRDTRDTSPRNKDVRSVVCSRSIRDISPRSKEVIDINLNNRETSFSSHKDHMDKNIFEVMETSPSKKKSPKKISPNRSPKKTSPNLKSKDLEASLRALKSESERVRLEKSKKFNTEESPKSSPKPQQSHERRSPRNLSPSSLTPTKTSSSAESPVGLERPKINIFTDDIGKDLGKRIRSPRRLSEDMIALPIFSLRARAGQSPKEGLGFSKYADDENNFGFIDSVNSSSNIFKTPSDRHMSPSKKLSNQKTSECKDTFLKQPKIETGDAVDECSDGSRETLTSVQKYVSHALLMSTICKGVVKEMASTRSDLFMNKDEKKDLGSGDCADDNGKHDQGMEALDSVKLQDNKSNEIGENGDASCIKTTESDKAIGCIKEPLDDDNTVSDNDQDGVKPSLLCAMLVGDSHVVQDYSQKRQRYNPEVTEISDTETGPSRAVSPDPCLDEKQVKVTENVNVEDNNCQVTDTLHQNEMNIEAVESDAAVEDSQNMGDSSMKKDESENVSVLNDESKVNFESKNVEIKMEVLSSNSEENIISNVPKCDSLELISIGGESEMNVETDSDEKKQENSVEKKQQNTAEKLHENSVEQKHKISVEKKQEYGNDSECWKKQKIEFSSQLKKVNDDVLKLLDIDIEDQFMSVPDTEEIIKETVSEKETKLYKLIYDLTVSLKDNPNACDTLQIDKILKTCPKGSVPVVSSSFSDRKWEDILNRLKHEKLEGKKLRHRLKREHMDADMENLVEKMSASTLQSANEESNDNVDSDLKTDHEILLSQSPQSRTENDRDNEQIKEKKETIPSGNKEEKVNEQNSCLMSTSSSSLNGSLCDLDLDGMTHAATQALKVPDLISDTVSEPGASSMCSNLDRKNSEEDGRSLQMTRRFHKSKTCGDFSQESQFLSAPSSSGPLRRTNSSPQLLKSESAVHSRSNSPNLGKDQQVKSKLGGKIPVPGTSYSFKGTKKTVRKPRFIMDPKPLDILLQFVNDDKESKDIFFSQDLQRFLWMPSNRMIVTPAIRNEISIADKTAEEAWKKKLQLMQEEEERQRKKDEEIDREYMRYEPGFDEVDGLLFMSFSSEAELLAHVRVEKALEWDKDDTMLRIARAKTFEETKAINGDMKGVKMKKLRGQHMRWKKYKRLYGHEVEAVLTAKEKNIPLEDLKLPEKTSDVSKIKGWKKKSSFSRLPAPEAKENAMTHVTSPPHPEILTFNSSLASAPECIDFQSYQDMEEGNSDKKEYSSKSRRQFNFSDRKAHKQLFKELNMDWEDRMIHRKLGGWSLKGNRPKEFSQAAKKRELKEIKALGLEVPSTKTHHGRATETYADLMGRKRRVVFPLITERMALSCLQTLELSDDLCQAARRRKRKKRFRSTDRSINTRSSFPPDILPSLASSTSTPRSSVATAGSLEKTMDLSTPEASVSLSESTINTTASPSLSLDLPDETVVEGVEIVSHASSPSIAESVTTLNSPQVKSCNTPGCRYGCICHLLPGPVSKASSTQDCNKEYCRLGCVCDSLCSEQPLPSHQSHCRKPSCMLECHCSPDSNNAAGAAGASVEDNEDMPYLSALKQRPSRAGERFSNLPRREKTHRSAKNLDAITRKAMMLYETSEIFCEKVERVGRKKSEVLSSPPTSLAMGYPASTSSQPLVSMMNTARTSFTGSMIKSEPPPRVVEHSGPSAPLIPSTVAFNAVNLVTSEVATVTASHFSSSRSQQFPSWRSKRQNTADIEMDEVRRTLPVIEPSTHKRKRKSHPLSDEIFSISSCARIQPYSWTKDRAAKLKFNLELIEFQAKNFAPQLPSTSSCPSPPVSSPALPPNSSSNSSSGDQEMNLKISSVCTLADEVQKEDKKKQSNGSGQPEIGLTISKTFPCENVPESSIQVSNPLTVTSKDSFSGKLNSASKQKHVHGKKVDRIGMKVQQQNWHTSMVCLKARAAPKTNDNSSDGDDIQEEDEVKLLEFAANCNWDKAKKEILSRVASCLLRGQYPQPRTMTVRDFMVEILPKAKQPSLIPPTLRAKLPGQMYSIRVRITKLDCSPAQSDGKDCDSHVIDLSQSSPGKQMSNENLNQNSANVVKNLNSSLSCVSTVSSSLPSKVNTTLLSSPAVSSSLPASPLSTSRPAVSDSFLGSSIGISGLNRIYNISLKNPTVQQNANPQQSKSAPGSRRSSTENYKEFMLTLPTDDKKPAFNLGKIQLVSTPNQTGVSTSILNPFSNKSSFTSVTTTNQSPDTTVSTSNSSSDTTMTTSNHSPVSSTMTVSNPSSDSTVTSSNHSPVSIMTVSNRSSDTTVISSNRSSDSTMTSSNRSSDSTMTSSNRSSDSTMTSSNRSSVSTVTSSNRSSDSTVTSSNRSSDSSGITPDHFSDIAKDCVATSSRSSNCTAEKPSSHSNVTLDPIAVSADPINSTKDNIVVSHPALMASSISTTTNTSTCQSSQSSLPSPMQIRFSTLQACNLNKIVGSSAATSLLNPDSAFRKERPNLKVPSFAVAAPSKTSISPTSVKELKYVQMLYEVDGQNEKKKTLIAVPISLTGANVDAKGQSTLSTMPILTVPKPGVHSKHMPITIAPRNKAKLPQVISGSSVIMKLPQINSASKSESPPTLKSLQIIPFSSVSSLLSNSSTITKLSPVLSPVSIPNNSNSSLKNGNEVTSTHGSICDVEQDSVRKDVKALEGTSVTQSRDRPIPSIEVSPPREILSTSNVVNTPCSSSNGISEHNNVVCSSNEIDQMSKEGNTFYDDQNKNIGLSCKNSPKPHHFSSEVPASENQKTGKNEMKESDGHELCNYTSPTADTFRADVIVSKNMCITDNPAKMSNDASNAVCPNTATITVETTTISNITHSSEVKALQSESSLHMEPKAPPTSESHFLRGQIEQSTKQSSENKSNLFEFVDMDDLFVSTISDVTTTCKSVDDSSVNISVLDFKSGQTKQQQACKRRMSPELLDEVDYGLPSGSKKPKMLPEISGILDEDSNLSSLITASPQSFTSLQKSALSSGRSSGSMEDVISSDEEIDVGEDLICYQSRVEKAWENDHSSMFSKAPPRANVKVLAKQSRKREAQGQEKEYHNLLERSRRAKLKELFDSLGNTIMTVPGMKRPITKDIKDADGAYVMPKATVLTEAKSAILHLNEKDKWGQEEIHNLMRQKEMLFAQLKELKAQLLTNNMSGRAIAAIINKVSRKKEKDPWISNEEREHSTEIMGEFALSPVIVPNPTEQINVSTSPATDVVVDTANASEDMNIETCPVHDNTEDNTMRSEEPLEKIELELHPI